jgi:hypothetical protein
MVGHSDMISSTVFVPFRSLLAPQNVAPTQTLTPQHEPTMQTSPEPLGPQGSKVSHAFPLLVLAAQAPFPQMPESLCITERILPA